MLKVAIVGCGKIADSHALQIKRIPGCNLVAACDREELMARQFAERFAVPSCFDELDKMLSVTRPDVVHITTPPAGHFSLARRCLQSRCHVYVEKPFTLDTTEAEELIAFAQAQDLKITVGHDDQFRHAARRMRTLVQHGYLGGPPVHMESYYCYELGDGRYAKALLTDREHWVRRLPGQLLQNVISHGIARIAEFLKTDQPQVIAHGFVSPFLRAQGAEGIIDELRVIISEEENMTAYFTFSSQMRPALHQFRIFGPANGLSLDQDNETLIRLPGKRYKSYIQQFVPPAMFAKDYLSNAARNVRAFLANDFHFKSGMKYLFERFYQSISNQAPLPIEYREILVTSRIMDAIFLQLRKSSKTGLAGLDGPQDAQIPASKI